MDDVKTCPQCAEELPPGEEHECPEAEGLDVPDDEQEDA
jgi:hypothetical protein